MAKTTDSKDDIARLNEFMKGPRVLVFDIETSFKIAGVWGLYKQDLSMKQVIQDMYVLCWSAKWLGEKKMISDSLHNHKKLFKKDPTDDSKIMETLWKLLDEADFVVAHNGAKFDVPIVNRRFLQHGMQPPSPYRIIDTLKVARRIFKFTSNRLGDLGVSLNLGKKAETGGFELWHNTVIHHDISAFKKMVKYCEQDTRLLEDVYLALRPWDKSHPNFAIHAKGDVKTCNVCGSTKIKKNGTAASNALTYQRYKCTDCGHNMRARTSDSKSKEFKENSLRSL